MLAPAGRHATRVWVAWDVADRRPFAIASASSWANAVAIKADNRFARRRPAGERHRQWRGWRRSRGTQRPRRVHASSRTGLRVSKTEIEKRRPETGGRKLTDLVQGRAPLCVKRPG